MRLTRKAKKKLTHQECNDLSHHLVLQQSIVMKILQDRIAHVVHTTYIVAKNGKQNSGEFIMLQRAIRFSINNRSKKRKIKFISFHYLHTWETK